MKNKGQLIIGGLLVLIGLFYIAGIVLDINLRGTFWAILLILAGVWLLVRPRLTRDGRDDYVLIGDIVRTGRWKAENESYWMLIGDVKLDLSGADLPEGETVLRTYMLIGDVKVIAPREIALHAASYGLIHEVNLFGQKQDSFLGPVELETPAYAAAARRIRLESTALIGGLKVKSRDPERSAAQ